MKILSFFPVFFIGLICKFFMFNVILLKKKKIYLFQVKNKNTANEQIYKF